MGCIARLGCLVLLAVLAFGGWLTRDRWLHRVTGSSPATTSTTTTATGPVWEPLSPAAGERGKRAIDALARKSGPVFTNLSAGEVASYVFQSASRTLPASADSVEAAVIGDALYVRAVLPVKDLAGSGALGPLAGLLNERERLQLGGSFRVIRPGLSEFQIREIKLRDFKVPSGAIPRIVTQISRGTRPEGVAANALPVTTPRDLADVRIANGRVTLYRTTAEAVQ
jgi:hypothetical protein